MNSPGGGSASTGSPTRPSSRTAPGGKCTRTAPSWSGAASRPGDRVTASVTVTRQGYRLAVADSTHQANTFTIVQPCPSGVTCYNASAEWIAETPGGARGLWPWPRFGTWRPVNARATSAGRAGGIGSFPDDQIVIFGDDGQTLASTGNLASSASTLGLTWTYAY